MNKSFTYLTDKTRPFLIIKIVGSLAVMTLY